MRTITENQTRYEVHIDNDDLQCIYNNDGTSFDFGNEKDNLSYIKEFKDGELCSYGVIKQEVCKCCNMWSDIDSLWAIHARSEEEAFQVFKDHAGVI